MFCFKIVAVLGMHFCDPNQLIATKQHNKLAAANKALCCLTRGSFKEDQHTQASLTCVCLSLRLFVRTVWLDVETPETFFFPRAQRDGGKASYAPALATPKTNRHRTAVRPRRPPRPPAPAA